MSWETRKVEYGPHQGKTWKALIEEDSTKVDYVHASWIGERNQEIKRDLFDVLTYGQSIHGRKPSRQYSDSSGDESLVASLNELLEAKAHQVRDLQRALEEKDSALNMASTSLKCCAEAADDTPYKEKFLNARSLLYQQNDLISALEKDIKELEPKGLLIDQQNCVRIAEGKSKFVLPIEPDSFEKIESEYKLSSARTEAIMNL